MIRVRLSDLPEVDLKWAVYFANSIYPQKMATHNRSKEDEDDEKLRGMFCEELTYMLKLFDIKRNSQKQGEKLPEFVDNKGKLWDLKTTTRMVSPLPYFSCPYCIQNIDKDKSLNLTGYIVATFKIPCTASERHRFTEEVFRKGNLALLKQCEIIFSGWIFYDEFKRIARIVLAGEDLNLGTGRFQPAQYDNYVCFVKELNQFPLP